MPGPSIKIGLFNCMGLLRGLADDTCEYTNEIHATATPAFLDFLKAHNISLAQAANDQQLASDAHNHEETLLFAKSIEQKALTGHYGI